MAPNHNKKKKKPASNPARGFATTSTVSKSRVAEDTSAEEVTTDISTPPTELHTAVVNGEPSLKGSDLSKGLSELTPEQLELQLERSELQLLVEKYGEKSQRDVKRHATRLQKDRKLTRLQSERLPMSFWLPNMIVTEINEHLKQSINEPVPFGEARPSGSILGQEDVVIKVWTLKRTLVDLGLSENWALQAVTHLIRGLYISGTSLLASSKDALWGLDYCLEWLALTAPLEDLPDYESHVDNTKQRDTCYSSHVNFSMDPAQVYSVTNTQKNPFQTGSTSESGPTDNRMDNDRDLVMKIEPESDDDVEPLHLLDRYLELQQRLFARQPELTDIEVRRPRGARAKKAQVTPLPTAKDPVTAKLVKRIKKLQSDMLFDKEEAYEKWSQMRLGLIKAAAEKEKISSSSEARLESSSAKNDEESQDSGPDGSANDGDLPLGLEEFLSSLPDSHTDPQTGASTIVETTSEGASITIRDFGTWKGVSPRKVLEDACKARDPSVRVSFKVISQSSFSNRRSVTIRWAKDQDLPAASPIPAISCQANPRVVKVDMIVVSTPDLNQAEAYVSTAAHFLIFVSSPKEEKGYLRLPPAWRDFWGELLTSRKERIDEEDRQELSLIRKLIDGTHEESLDRTPVFQPSEQPREEEHDQRVVETCRELEVTDGRELITLWKSKASSPSYNHMLQSRMKLPIWNYKVELLTAIENNQVVIVCGETGSGKSTQLPLYICESELSNGRPCKIYCAEPRRISAISLARRVSEELGERKNDVGTTRSLIGYAVRLESKVTPGTKLVYATTGIVMRMMERLDDLKDITHLVLDEVHERTIDSDFLLIILRRLMLRRPELKVILMSATVNASQFSKYLNDAPILNVEGRTFPVETRFLEDAIEESHYIQDHVLSNGQPPDEEEDLELEEKSTEEKTTQGDLSRYSVATRKTLAQFDEYHIDFQLITTLLVMIANGSAYSSYSKAILVFLPGIGEIRKLNNMLVGHPAFSHGWYIFPLHSTIAMEEQERAFLIPPNGIRKIVLATNIAETGITIPDVTCVIDGGKHREMRFDERRQLSRLIESFISRANAKQRRGRAGRVQSGLCFHLFTKARHDEMMLEQQIPEMLRLSLQDLVLRVKICKLGSIEQTLLEALDPPLPKNIRRAIDSLVEVGAITTAEDLTPLGRQLAKLPLDVFLGKLVLLGSIFRCLDASLTIAAILSSKSPFVAPFGSRVADVARLAFKKGDSDLLSVYNAYCAWRRVCKTNMTGEYQFCRKNCLSSQVLSNIEDLKAQLTTSLVDGQFLELGEAETDALNRVRFYSRERHFVEIPPDYNANENDLVLTSVIAWSFYPKLLAREGKGWRNVANNQSVSLHPTSVNKGVPNPPKYLSFYHIMQSSNKFYNAHETSPVEDFAIAVLCGDAEFLMYSGVIVIDGNRFRFALDNWKAMIAIKHLRLRLKEMIASALKQPGRHRDLGEKMAYWFNIWKRIFVKVESKI